MFSLGDVVGERWWCFGCLLYEDMYLAKSPFSPASIFPQWLTSCLEAFCQASKKGIFFPFSALLYLVFRAFTEPSLAYPTIDLSSVKLSNFPFKTIEASGRCCIFWQWIPQVKYVICDAALPFVITLTHPQSLSINILAEITAPPLQFDIGLSLGPNS